ncbi:hypothetical protein [Herpetosiphon geysericola]|uniref:Uncharacterized protein n=1 Tax=Herpetosiphon geysericola TaxID=70996 RepID=A0A0P6YLP8_9CHLR|nr:hypothetical protein [Herpetosiphon geysericola]KPL86173.1 hypothetical protein SE18_15065 [Herpetosiphon geysericola]
MTTKQRFLNTIARMLIILATAIIALAKSITTKPAPRHHVINYMTARQLMASMKARSVEV